MAPRKKSTSETAAVEVAATPGKLETIFNERANRDYWRQEYIDIATKNIIQFERVAQKKFPYLREIATELPDGVYFTGGAITSTIRNKNVRNYDFMFRDEKAFTVLVKRIHAAKEGSFFHGYESKKSFNDLVASFDEPVLEFTHASKPPIQLIRSRWFSEPNRVLYACDMSTSMYVLTGDFNVTYWTQALVDARNNQVRMNNVSFYAGTGARLERMLNQEGVRLQSHNNLGGYERDHFLQVYRNMKVKNAEAANTLFAGR